MYVLRPSTLARLQAAISDITLIDEATVKQELAPMVRFLKGTAPGLATVSGSIDRTNTLTEDTLNYAIMAAEGDNATGTNTTLPAYGTAGGWITVGL